MPYKNGSKLCICELCNCGRHRCPHRPQHRGPVGECVFSEYTNKYTAHKIVPVESCKPKLQAVLSGEPISDKTTHRMDFISHPLERPHVHKQAEYQQPEGDFDGTTMYQKEFVEKPMARQQAIRRDMKRGVPAKFEGEPTYKSDYKRWEMPLLERTNTSTQWRPNDVPFEGIPTYQTDFIQHAIRPTTSCKPNLTANMSAAPFEGITDYRDSYIKHALEPKLAKEKLQYARPHAPFEGLSTFQRDFTPKEGGRMKSCKPLASVMASGAPLSSDTTFRTDFKPWELSRPALHQADPYKQPEGDIDHNTTYNNDYPLHPMAKRDAIRQVPRGMSSAPFEGTTDYRDNYKKWNAANRKLMGPNNDYIPPSVPFAGQSTTQEHYIRHPLDPRRSFKPDASRNLNEQPFDGNTLYRTEYTPKLIEPCPAALLDTERANYVFTEQDESGHKFYETTGATARAQRVC